MKPWLGSLHRSSFAFPALLLITGIGCSDSSPAARAPGYLASSACSQHLDAKTCAADAANGCAWAEMESLGACAPGDPCTHPSGGVCYAQDPCLDHQDTQSCAADSRCAWSAVSSLCPVGADCAEGGFCHSRDAGGGDCACVSPLSCPMDGPCPAVECDCSGGGGGGTCTCACPDIACAPGETCAPCDCSCDDGGGTGCVDEGTCACACPSCAPGETCPPCDCSCGGAGGVSTGGVASGGAPSATGSSSSFAPDCACAPCDPNTDGPCPACDCPPPPVDPCLTHLDPSSCGADSGNGCTWYATGAPCIDGMSCAGGICQGGGIGCACACPGCGPGESCPPCVCDCGGSGGGGGGCVPPPEPAPVPAPTPVPL